MTRAEIAERYDKSAKGRRWRKQWVKENKEHLAEYHAQWVKKNSTKAAAAVAKWRKENRLKYNAQIKKYQAANKEKFVAYRKVRKALKAGILIRPEKCERCDATSKIDAHHHKGYEHPLEVLWLCRQCHVDQHPRTITE